MKKNQLLCLVFCIAVLWLKPAFASIELVDAPNAKVVDYYNMNLNFKLHSGGGVLTQMVFGVFRKLNLGLSWEVENLIGTQTPHPRPPCLNLKFRIFDGSSDIPSFAIGYDGQGYNYSEESGSYITKEKGVYVVSDMEFLTKNLWLTLGLNMNFSKEVNNEKANLFGFSGISYSIMNGDSKAIDLIAEYDNIGEILGNNRFNAALRLYPAQSLNIDFAFRDIASPQNNVTDRLIKINYQTEF